MFNIIWIVEPTFISWSDSCEKAASFSSADFHHVSSLSDAISVTDGCHIGVQNPQIREGDYITRSHSTPSSMDERGGFIDQAGFMIQDDEDIQHLHNMAGEDGWVYLAG